MLIVCLRAWHQDLGIQGVEDCWRMVQRLGGWMEPHIMSVDFYVEEHRWDFLIIAYPQLERRPLRDYVI